jgi:hypothetical protein
MTMSEALPEKRSAATTVREHLRTIAQLLREEPQLSPETQQLLAELADELSRALESEAAPPAELNDIAMHVAQLVRAAHRGEQAGLVARLRNRLDTAAAGLESRSPLIAGLTRRLIDALTELGI